MSEFLRLLALYYLCDSTAALRPLSAHEVAMCMETYRAVKSRFAAEPLAPRGTPERAAQNRAAYAGFKAWEAAHPELVAKLRAKAALLAGQDVSSKSRVRGQRSPA